MQTLISDVEAEIVSLSATVETTIKAYLKTMGQDNAADLYYLLMEQVEPPLFRAVIEHCRYNQSRAADILGISRGTCRTKLMKYFNEQYCGRRE